MKKRKKIVTIGGGTGSFTLLSGLKNYPVDIAAIVSMADDGGSTGVLRDELGVLPPGDVRQCLVALSDSSEQMRELMTYRFENGGLQGHSFGNLLLSALEKTSGSFVKGVEQAMHILDVKGEVVPVTGGDAKLELHLKDGTVLRGENEINHHTAFQSVGVADIRYAQEVCAYDKAIRKIQQADMIVISSGNLYCSLLPNLIIPAVAEAIGRSRAQVVYVCNLTNKKGHTTGWDVDDYVDALERYIGRDRIDYVLYNARKLPNELVRRYEEQEGERTVVEFDPGRKSSRGYKLVQANIASTAMPHVDVADAIATTRALIRHDSDKLAQAVMFVLELESHQDIIYDIV